MTEPHFARMIAGCKPPSMGEGLLGHADAIQLRQPHDGETPEELDRLKASYRRLAEEVRAHFGGFYNQARYDAVYRDCVETWTRWGWIR